MTDSAGPSPPPRLRAGIDLTRAGLSFEEGLLISRVDGRTSVRDLAILVGKPLEETRRLIDRFLEVGILVEGTDPQAHPPSEDTGPYHDFAFPADALAEPVDLSVEQKKRILYTHHHLDKWSLYQLLGVRWRDDKNALKRAYFERSKEWHPDRFPRANLGSYRVRIEAIFKAVREAHEVLKDPERKKSYDDTAGLDMLDERDMADALKAKRREARQARRASDVQRRRRDSNPILQRIKKAKRMYAEALIHEERGELLDALHHAQGALALHDDKVYKTLVNDLKSRTAVQRIRPLIKRGRNHESLTEWDQAIAVFAEAVRQAPEHGEARLRLAYNLLMAGRPATAINEHVHKAAQQLPEEPEVHYVRGLFYERASMSKAAVGAYERALELRPGYEAARKRLRRLKWGF